MKNVRLMLVKTSNVSAKLIRFGMDVYAMKNDLPKIDCYNHCEIVIDNKTTGAISPAVKTRDLYAYIRGLKEKGIYIDHKFIELTLTDSEYNAGIELLNKFEGVKYEYTMFISHATSILFNFWLGRKGAKRVSCYELLIRYINSINRWPKLDVTTNPYQLDRWFKNNSLT